MQRLLECMTLQGIFDLCAGRISHRIVVEDAKFLHKRNPLSRKRNAAMPKKRIRDISHERLAYFFVMSQYIVGIFLTAVLIIEVLSWDIMSRFSTFRLVGLLITISSFCLLFSRVIAGRYGNRIASHLSPRTLDYAVSVRRMMGDFGLHSSKELNSFIILNKLRVYSSRKAYSSDYARHFTCSLEPLFTHDMYLPLERNLLIRNNRLWFNGQELEELVKAHTILLSSVDYAWMRSVDRHSVSTDPPK